MIVVKNRKVYFHHCSSNENMFKQLLPRALTSTQLQNNTFETFFFLHLKAASLKFCFCVDII